LNQCPWNLIDYSIANSCDSDGSHSHSEFYFFWSQHEKSLGGKKKLTMLWSSLKTQHSLLSTDKECLRGSINSVAIHPPEEHICPENNFTVLFFVFEGFLREEQQLQNYSFFLNWKEWSKYGGGLE